MAWKSLFWKQDILSYEKAEKFNKEKKIIYLREVCYTYIYPNNINSPFLHRHINLCSQFFIKQIQKTKHIYIDGTFVFPCEFKQLIIILFYDFNTGARYPGEYILINSNYYQSYLIALNSF